MTFKAVRGTKDILPEQILSWQRLEEKTKNIFSLYGYKEIRTPILEETALFQRSLGEHTEIVEKQMFTIQRDEDSLVLRPEATAGIVRAYLENNLDKTEGFVKLYYIGPMFRAERPQKGRLRQFHQIGCEAIGSNSPDLDAEIITLSDTILRTLGITDHKIKINNLGCSKDKAKLADNLKKDLKNKLNTLCPDCQNRYSRNVFRILDCKNEKCRAVILELKLKGQHLCEECKSLFSTLQDDLKAIKVDYEIDHTLVRGLDYYTRTVFEISHDSLGSQDAIGAGGRYDNLVEELGGEKTGAIGFALGIERLLLLIPEDTRQETPEIFIVTLSQEAIKKALVLSKEFRDNGISCELDYNAKSLKSQMRQADKLKVRFVAILGEDELKNNTVSLKNMSSGQQKQVSFENIINELKK